MRTDTGTAPRESGGLWINEFPDRKADAAAGKRTLVVRWGRRAASRAFAGIVSTAFLSIALLPLAGLPLSTWLGFAGAPHAALAARRLFRDPASTPRLIPAQSWMIAAFVLAAIGLGCGLLVA